MPHIHFAQRSGGQDTRSRARRPGQRENAFSLPPSICYKKLSSDDIQDLDLRMQTAFGWSEPSQRFQMAGATSQLEGTDMVIQAATGAGKTAVVAAAHLWKTGVTTLMIVPLLELENEMVSIIILLLLVQRQSSMH